VLDYEEAYAAWKNTRIVQNNNRYGELASDWDGPDDWELAGAYTIARTKLAEEQAAKIRLEREEMEGHLLRDEDVIKVCGNTIIAFRSHMLAVPGKLSRLIAGITGYADLVALEAVIQPVIYEALEDLSRLYSREEGRRPESSV
jgi:phage terminase Nu1 subunit (DNA packaging protein)